jgi:hypothetical protein
MTISTLPFSHVTRIVLLYDLVISPAVCCFVGSMVQYMFTVVEFFGLFSI